MSYIEKITNNLDALQMGFDIGKTLDHRFGIFSNRMFTDFMQDFVSFNSCFAGGALRLASLWALSDKERLQQEENYFTNNPSVASLVVSTGQ